MVGKLNFNLDSNSNQRTQFEHQLCKTEPQRNKQDNEYSQGFTLDLAGREPEADTEKLFPTLNSIKLVLSWNSVTEVNITSVVLDNRNEDILCEL